MPLRGLGMHDLGLATGSTGNIEICPRKLSPMFLFVLGKVLAPSHTVICAAIGSVWQGRAFGEYRSLGVAVRCISSYIILRHMPRLYLMFIHILPYPYGPVARTDGFTAQMNIWVASCGNAYTSDQTEGPSWNQTLSREETILAKLSAISDTSDQLPWHILRPCP